MSFLIDTHVLLWFLLDSKSLSEKAKNILLDIDNDIYISPISLWEISLKYSINKLKLGNGTPDDLFKQIEEMDLKILELNPGNIVTSYKLPFIEKHNDPFDRMIIWQAIKNNMTLISKDSNFNKYKELGLQVCW